MVCFVLTPRSLRYRHAATTFYQLQRGFGGRRQHARIQEFCQFYLVCSLFYSLQRGSNGIITEKTILILYQGFRGGPLVSRGMCPTFSGGGGGGGGPNANFYRNPYTYLLFSRGYPDPLSPFGSAHRKWHHNGTIFITVPLLTIIVRH